MAKRFYVIDAEGNPSWSVKDKSPECFRSQETARKRATELAESEPGKTIYIAQAIESVECEVSPAKRKPLV